MRAPTGCHVICQDGPLQLINYGTVFSTKLTCTRIHTAVHIKGVYNCKYVYTHKTEYNIVFFSFKGSDTHRFLQLMVTVFSSIRLLAIVMTIGKRHVDLVGGPMQT